jgi:uncharacterized protein YebE (UPF0316 family)
MKNLLIIFIVANIVNVIIQTVKSLCTVKCGKVVASVVNALAYGFYTYIIVLTTCELQTFTKAIIVALCNLVGVYTVKYFEEKIRKDKLWKVELTVNKMFTNSLVNDLSSLNIPHNYIQNIGKYTVFNIYCATQKESKQVKQIANRYSAKYFVTETKEI